ncbi:ATP-binding protein [Dyella flagellata]|uniref:ATPase AAA n=1 Tax=Dyella flagellata TaxID=1867833 RepID=A0ABQ5XFC0_9GAMM|nr:ATP-binding protein [Dyella flagellata]GLQ89926.1 ATPase AAA [Dyella flagellata]
MTLAPALYPITMLARLDRLIEREILRLRARYQMSLDEFRGLYISDAQVDELIAQAYANAGLEECDDIATDGDEIVRDNEPKWERLRQAFSLAPCEEDLILIALAPELDLKYETLYAYLNNDITRKWPTTDLARRLLGDAAAVESALDRLRRIDVLQLIEVPSSRPSLLNTGFAPNPALVRHLLGTTRKSDASSTAPLSHDAQLLARLIQLLGPRSNDPPVLVLQAATRYERESLAVGLADRLGLPWRCLDLAVLRREGLPLQKALKQCAFECRLQATVLLLEGLEALGEREMQAPAELNGCLDLPISPMLIAVHAQTPWRDLLGQRRALPLCLQAPSFTTRAALWQQAAPTLSTEDCAVLAERFAFSARQIETAIADAEDLRILHGLPSFDAKLLRHAARQQLQSQLGALASKIDRACDWSDLVLPDDVLERLREIAAAIRYRHRVYHEWGFLERDRGGGMRVLFAGASGTGKTMTASVIAHELDLDLYRIDLSGIVSKYIGDTEKNLDRIFDAASAHNAVLFFDEADAMFGKRSEVKDAHDRYANIEVAYLLQKLEEHSGVVMLATNFKRNIDEAFTRRMHYVVDFPKPDATLRERLWRGMFPERAPLQPDVDFEFLARQFELPGGDIRTTALDAAFLAAQEQQAIGMQHVVRALARQMAKQGTAPSPIDFKQYHALLRR